MSTTNQTKKRYAVKSGSRESIENTRQAIAHREEFKTGGALHGTKDVYFEGRLRGATLDRFWADRRLIDYAVMSYGTPIAWHVQGTGEGRWVVVGDKFSATTTSHQSAVLSAMRLLALESGHQEFETITMHGSI